MTVPVAKLSGRCLLAVLLVAGCLVPAGVAHGAKTAPACSADMAGGDWATYGQALVGQQGEGGRTTIGADNVSALQEAWRGPDQVVQSAPPIVANGCVFLNTDSTIEALDLHTGALVWKATGINTVGTFAPTVVDGRVHIALDSDGQPRAAALDEHTGKLLWT